MDTDRPVKKHGLFADQYLHHWPGGRINIIYLFKQIHLTVAYKNLNWFISFDSTEKLAIQLTLK